jgi:torulene dioxygenase
MVARPESTDEDDGVILSIVFHRLQRRSFLLVLAANDLHEMGRAWLPFVVPFGIQAAFALRT